MIFLKIFIIFIIFNFNISIILNKKIIGKGKPTKMILIKYFSQCPGKENLLLNADIRVNQKEKNFYVMNGSFTLSPNFPNDTQNIHGKLIV